MNAPRIEVVLPADVSAHDYTTVTHAVWTVLSAAGLDDDSEVRAESAPWDEEARPGRAR